MSIDSITIEQINARLDQVVSAEIQWTGRMPENAESWSTEADRLVAGVMADDVQNYLRCIDDGGVMADVELIDAAIALACEPAGLPEGGMVNVHFAAPRCPQVEYQPE